ncbi:hypothetical protein HOE425_200025 [Hoeflea sp. EC-HK425]|nr:hypothetical protein HOE425_200025 [Hoeflea sp. EC-HK425]
MARLPENQYEAARTHFKRPNEDTDPAKDGQKFHLETAMGFLTCDALVGGIHGSLVRQNGIPARRAERSQVAVR